MKTLFIGFKSTGSDARSTRWGVLASSLAAVALLAAPLAIEIGSNGASGLIGSAEARVRLTTVVAVVRPRISGTSSSSIAT